MDSLITAAGTIGVNTNKIQIEQFRLYRELLMEWGRRINLTSVKDPDEIIERLFIRSLRIAVQAGGSVATAEWFTGRQIIDVGSGAGIPGLPLKLVLPDAKVTLVESNRKKCDFIEHVVSELGLEGVTVLNYRAEDVAHDAVSREIYDLATARGVAHLSILAEYVLPFLRLGGVAVLPKGPNRTKVECEADEAAFAADELGAAPAIIQPVKHPGNSPTDHIVYWLKVRPTPDRYPRSAGIPAKRPLSATRSIA